MANHDTPQHPWPDDEPTRVAPAVKRGRLARIGRALGDAFLTAGMSRGMTGDRSAEGDKAISNAMLFGEGKAKGDHANDVPDRD